MSTKTSFEKGKADIVERVRTNFGDGRGMLTFILVQLSLSRQPCDITFYDRLPMFDVTIDPKMNILLLYGAGGRRQERLQSIFTVERGGGLEPGAPGYKSRS